MLQYSYKVCFGETMKNIKNDIAQNDYKPVYLLCGEEAFLINTYKNMLKEGICGDNTMNLSVYRGEDIDVDRIAEDCMAMPFFAPRRLVLIENSGMIKASSDKMAAMIKELPETTCVIFAEQEIDKRNKLYKAIKEKGYICEMKPQKPDDLCNWICKILGSAGKKIRTEDARLIIMKTGTDMYNIYNEIQKLIAYTGESNIVDRNAINLMCSELLEDKIFDMIDAIARKDTARTMKLYGDLLTLKVAPLKMLAILSKKYAQLLSVKDMKNGGCSSQEIASRVGIHPYFVKQYIDQAGNFSEKDLKIIIEDCISTETDIKSGRMEDKYAVELLIMKYSRKKG